jgi:hypothetical protein
LKVGYASSRAHKNKTSRSCFHNSHNVLQNLAQAALIEGGLRVRAHNNNTRTNTNINNIIGVVICIASLDQFA